MEGASFGKEGDGTVCNIRVVVVKESTHGLNPHNWHQKKINLLFDNLKNKIESYKRKLEWLH